MKNEGKKLYLWRERNCDNPRGVMDIFEKDLFYKDERIIKEILTEIPDIADARLPDDLPLLERFLCNILLPLAWIDMGEHSDDIPHPISDKTIPPNERDRAVTEEFYYLRGGFSFDIYADSLGLKDVLRKYNLPLPQGFYSKEPDNTKKLTEAFDNTTAVTLQSCRDKLSEIRNAHRPKSAATSNATPSATAPLTWKEVEITLLRDKTTISIVAEGLRKDYTFDTAGMDNHGKPSRSWTLLLLFVVSGGFLSPDDLPEDKHTQVSRLRKKLNALVPQVEGNPITFHNGTALHGYKTEFRALTPERIPTRENSREREIRKEIFGEDEVND